MYYVNNPFAYCLNAPDYNQDIGFRMAPMPHFFNQPPYHHNNPFNFWGFYPMPYYPWMHHQHFCNQFNPQHGHFTYGQHHHQSHRADNNPPAAAPSQSPALRDYGPQPISLNINEATKRNDNYRTALWTGNHHQVTLMSLKPGEDIGLESHPNVDQFLRIESGEGITQMGPTRDNLNYQRAVSDDDAIMVPAGTWHNIINTGREDLKLYSIYSPPNHPKGTMQPTKAIAEMEEAH